MRRGDGAAFYEAMWDALTDYFGHRLNLAPGDVTLQTVTARLPREIDAVETLFSTIEQRRYGYQRDEESKEEMRELLRRFTRTLRTCERMKL
jgi:hypothetical protein